MEEGTSVVSWWWLSRSNLRDLLNTKLVGAGAAEVVRKE